ncbi:asparagine synthetase domain-containing protein 1-like [Dendronephthya gigantea]|uniref:asparagine synthetase domain-containing protein 1-like n=1 Tax=Dendronephthya gigantea TaxID=151771 RepID=UPI001069AA5F|nr:asparagine synthetase domain-containing protein 1-like [Dendronephthya gigantea]
MCGIFCAICPSTEEANLRRKEIITMIKSLLQRRGPDNFGEKHIVERRHSGTSCDLSNCFIHLSAAVLHLRGECIAKQPVEDTFGNVLAWNGEIFAGIKVTADESDTSTLLKRLHTSMDDNVAEHVLRTMSQIRGPWAFVYYQASKHTLWFGRDFFGRRSLLWHLPSSSTDLFTLSSVGTRSADDTGGQFWKEVPANGIYSIDLRKFGDYFSSEEASAVDVQTFLQRYPWQEPSSNKYPACPVPKQFNRKMMDDINSSESLSSTDCLKQPEQSLRQPEAVSSAVTGKTDKDKLSGTSRNSCINTNTTTKDDDPAYVTRSIANFRIKTPNYKYNTNIPGDIVGQSGETMLRGDIVPGSTEMEEQSKVGHTVEAGTASQSSELFVDEVEEGTDFDQLRDDQTNQCQNGGHISDVVVEQFANVLTEAVKRRVFNLPRKTENESETPPEEECIEKKSKSYVGILFSGGLDSIVLAALADRCIPSEERIDLINVAFEQRRKGKHGKQGGKHNRFKYRDDGDDVTNFDVPDRITGRDGVAELRQINPHRTWNFVEVNVTLEELRKERSNYITHLVSPLSTVLDDSIGCALWFAARGKGTLCCGEEISSSCDHEPSYTCPAKVLLVGMGADEQLGGYARHRSRFSKDGWKGLVDEIEMEVQRISERNLGRDDRCISDHGRESRFPFLDEDVVSFLNDLPVWIKCDPRLPRGIGEKILLRRLGKSLGLKGSSALPKRAIQFGSRIAKLESSSEKGGEKCNRF